MENLTKSPSASEAKRAAKTTGAPPRKISRKGCSGPIRSEPHKAGAAATNSVQQGVEHHTTHDGGGQPAREHHKSDAPDLIDAIREQWRRRQAWHRAEKSLTLQAKAICRRLVGGEIKDADKCYSAAMGKGSHAMSITAMGAILPLTSARDAIEKQRKAVEKELERMAKKLHVWPYVQDVRGVGPLMLAGIVGEAGDVGSYKSVSALWKRMGMAVISGGRQRRVAGVDALEHGYSPARRSLMWNIGDCITKAQIRKDPEDEEKRISLGELGQLYLDRKAYEAERVETKAHAHNRAKRYIEKRFLRNLYAAWRAESPTEPTNWPPAK